LLTPESNKEANKILLSQPAESIEVWMMITEPAERRQGVGMALLKSQIRQMSIIPRFRGEIKARCFPASIDMKRLLERAGFVTESQSPEYELFTCNPKKLIT
jgi:hypothetical protein